MAKFEVVPRSTSVCNADLKCFRSRGDSPKNVFLEPIFNFL